MIKTHEMVIKMLVLQNEKLQKILKKSGNEPKFDNLNYSKISAIQRFSGKEQR